MGFVYGHYEPDTYKERTYRKGTPCRIQIGVDAVGLYDAPVITPAPLGYPTSHSPRIVQRLYTYMPDGIYFNRDGQIVGWEFLGNDSTDYVVQITHDGITTTYTVPSLPIPPEAQYVVEEKTPYTIGGLVGMMMHGSLTGRYKRGGVRLGLSQSEARSIGAIVPYRHALFTRVGEWYLQLYENDGTEFAENRLIEGIPLVLDVKGYYR